MSRCQTPIQLRHGLSTTSPRAGTKRDRWVSDTVSKASRRLREGVEIESGLFVWMRLLECANDVVDAIDRNDGFQTNLLGAARLRMAVEEHGMGRQLVRFRVWPKPSAGAIALVVLFCGFSTGAALHRAWAGAAILAAMAMIVAARGLQECAAATGALLSPVVAEERAARAAAVPNLKLAEIVPATGKLRVRPATTVPGETAAAKKSLRQGAG